MGLIIFNVSTNFPILGVRSKPSLCALCPWAASSHSFVPGWSPRRPRFACLLEAPGENEALKRTPLVGMSGELVFHAFLRPLGLSRDDVILDNCIRCRGEENEYPDGAVRRKAEQICRQYDWYHGDARGNLTAGGIADWDPNLFVITLHPAAVLRENAYFFLVQKDFEKAARFMEAGHRVCVLCGDKAAALVLPRIEGTGGVSYWRGHHFTGSLRTERKLLDITTTTKSFRPVTAATWRRKRSKQKTVIPPSSPSWLF